MSLAAFRASIIPEPVVNQGCSTFSREITRESARRFKENSLLNNNPRRRVSYHFLLFGQHLARSAALSPRRSFSIHIFKQISRALSVCVCDFVCCLVNRPLVWSSLSCCCPRPVKCCTHTCSKFMYIVLPSSREWLMLAA